MSRSDFDLIVIGGGAGGFVASKLAAGLGKKTAMIEKSALGGECTLYGCIPSKTLIRVSGIAHVLKNANRFGLEPSNNVIFSADNVMRHVRSVVKKVAGSHPAPVFEKLGITVIFGSPQFIDSHHIVVNGKMISSKSFIIATGSTARIPPIPGIDTVPFLTNETVFNLDKLPKSMIVLGGGPIGIELSSALNRLGVEVTVVEMLDSILIRDDRELVQRLSERLQGEGVRILTKTKAVKMAREGGKVLLTIEDEHKQTKIIEADTILFAVGRKANVDGLDLEKAGVAYGAKGIRTDNKLRTTAPNIYACGDVVGPYQFSHMAEYQAIIATRNASLPFKKKVHYDNAAWCTFTDPELAHAGLTEEEARQIHGENIKVYRYEYGNIDRAKTDGTEFGMSKFICDHRGRLIGAHILGSRAGEIIHEAQIVKSLNVPFSRLNSVIHVYPTYSDVIKQPAKLSYIDRLRNNFFLKLIRKIMSQGKRGGS